jgi:hypothetical protein
MTAVTQDAGTAVPGNGGAAILRDSDPVSGGGPAPLVADAASVGGDKVVKTAGYYDVNPYWDDDDGTTRSRAMASAERYPPLP